MLNDRKRKILKTIVEEYIQTIQPVGSKTLVDNYDLNVSTATIRNEMAELEEMGYLDKTHVSSGRVPSTLGYRFYVDTLINDKENIKEEELSYIKENLSNQIIEVSEIVKHIGRAVSDMTNYTVISTGPNIKEATIEDIKLVILSNNMLLIVVLTDTNDVKETVLKLDKDISEETIEKLNNILRVKLRGIKLKDIDVEAIKHVGDELNNYLYILIPIFKEISKIVKESNIILDGANNIYNYPEFKSHDLAKNFLDVLEAKQLISEVLSVDNKDINIFIGDENAYSEFKDFSLITFKCPQNLGIVGIIGPTRMDYAKVLSVIEYIKSILNSKYKKGGYLDE